MSKASFDPLATCPAELRPRFRATADRVMAGGNRGSAIKLKCLDCCAWQSREVGRCEIRSCALWAVRPYQTKVAADEVGDVGVEIGPRVLAQGWPEGDGA